MNAVLKPAAAPLDVAALRAQFPILGRQIHGKPLVYLDSANTAQKPLAVIETLDHFYRHYNANVARAVHTLGEEATVAYEAVRAKAARFLGAASSEEIVYTRGTTEAINLVAHSWLRPRLQAGDEILVTMMEHHANIVPWQLLADQVGAKVLAAPVHDDGSLDLTALEAMISPRTRLIGVVHVSNVLGTVNPIAPIAKLARAHGVPLLVDGSQAAPHLAIDVQALGCDLYCFTGHKLYGPTGSGVLWARPELLAEMVPFMGGGEMIRKVSFAGTTFADPPHRFEAGTPNIAGIIGLGAAIDWVNGVGIEAIAAHEAQVGAHATQALQQIEGLRLIGTAPGKAPVLSFVIDGAHAHDLAMILDQEGIAVRSGHHCAHPLLQHYGLAATLRASLSVYNTTAEIDQLVAGLEKARRMLV
jgi:cysteine desulfurase/selenocysteine lyase